MGDLFSTVAPTRPKLVDLERDTAPTVEAVPTRPKLVDLERDTAPTVEWRQCLNERYNLCMLFYCLRKQDAEREEPTYIYGAFDRVWLEAQFSEWLSVPSYTLLKSISFEGGHGPHGPEFDGPTMIRRAIYDGKKYDCLGNGVEVTDCSDDSPITSLEHNHWVSCLTIADGKLYSGDDCCRIKIWDCKTHALLRDLSGRHNKLIKSLTVKDGKLYSSSGSRLGVWDCNDDYTLITALETEQVTGVIGIFFRKGKFYSRAWDGIKIWKL
jgi:hypothetical protein